MKITVNAQAHDVTTTTLSGVLVELGFEDAAIATAVNGSFVPRTARAQTDLREGDMLEILAPMQGG